MLNELRLKLYAGWISPYNTCFAPNFSSFNMVAVDGEYGGSSSTNSRFYQIGQKIKKNLLFWS